MGAEVESVARVNAALSMMKDSMMRMINISMSMDDCSCWRLQRMEVTRCAHTDHRPEPVVVLSLEIMVMASTTNK